MNKTDLTVDIIINSEQEKPTPCTTKGHCTCCIQSCFTGTSVTIVIMSQGPLRSNPAVGGQPSWPRGLKVKCMAKSWSANDPFWPHAVLLNYFYLVQIFIPFGFISNKNISYLWDVFLTKLPTFETVKLAPASIRSYITQIVLCFFHFCSTGTSFIGTSMVYQVPSIRPPSYCGFDILMEKDLTIRLAMGNTLCRKYRRAISKKKLKN